MQKMSKLGKMDKNICQMHYKRNHKLFDTLSAKFGKTLMRQHVVVLLYNLCMIIIIVLFTLDKHYYRRQFYLQPPSLFLSSKHCGLFVIGNHKVPVLKILQWFKIQHQPLEIVKCKIVLDIFNKNIFGES